MARAMKKFSAGGALGKYNRRMADIKKDFEKDSKGKSGRALEVLEAKRAQRTADAEDDRAKRMGLDRTATRAAERAAESNLTKTRKYGAPKAVTTEAPAAKVTDTLGAITAPKSGISSTPSRKPAQKRVQKPVQEETPKVTATDTPKPDAPKTDFRKIRGGSTSGAPTKPLPTTPFNRQAFVDLKVAAERGKPVNSQNPVLARMRAIAEAPGASRAAIYDYRRAVESGRYNKGGSVKKENTMKYAKGGSTPPQPTAADRARSKKQLAELKKLKPTAEQAKVIASANRSEGPGYKKGGKAKSFAATKFGAAMVKKSADTKGRAMVKKACGGSMKKYASGGLIGGHKSADGIAKKGKTKGKMV